MFNGKTTISMAIFNSYVKLPEGNSMYMCDIIAYQQKNVCL